MRRIPVLFLVLLVCSCVLAQKTDRIPTTLVMARYVKRLEPGWRYVGGWCTCPPIVPGQVWRDEGSWERLNRRGQPSVKVEIVKAASTDEAAGWMRRFGTKGSSCRVETSSLGDEGYLLTCSQRFQSQLRYRKGRYLVSVDGESQTLVERFGRYALQVVPAT